MSSVLALYVANAKEFARDRLAMFFTLLLPIMFALFFGMMFGNESSFKLNLGLVVEDRGVAGEQFAAQLTSAGLKDVLALQRGSRDELIGALGKGKLDAVLVLPATFSPSLLAGQRTPVEVYFDQSRQSSTGTARGLLASMLSEANLAISGGSRLLVAEERSVQSTPMKAADFFVPSLLGMAMLWLGLFATAQPIVELRVQQVLRRFGATPLSRVRLLIGQASWRVTLGIVQAVLFLLVGVFVMGVHLNGSPVLFAAAVLLGAFVFVSLGYCIASVAKTSEGAVAIAQVINFPMMFLSGTFFEPNMLPAFLKPVQQLLPLTYLSDALRQSMVSYAPLNPLWVDFAVLGGWLVVLVALSLKFFRWE